MSRSLFFHKDHMIGALLKIRHSNTSFPENFFEISKNTFFTEHHQWLLLHRKKLKNLLFFSSNFIFFIKEINNRLCIFSLPCFTVNNRKLSQEMCFILSVYYTGLCTGCSKKEATVRFFRGIL